MPVQWFLGESLLVRSGQLPGRGNTRQQAVYALDCHRMGCTGVRPCAGHVLADLAGESVEEDTGMSMRIDRWMQLRREAESSTPGSGSAARAPAD